MTTNKSPVIKFEAAIGELEKVVKELEKGDMPLEESLKQFEKGIKLTQQCQKALESAEQKVKILIEKHGQPALVDFDDDDEGNL